MRGNWPLSIAKKNVTGSAASLPQADTILASFTKRKSRFSEFDCALPRGSGSFGPSDKMLELTYMGSTTPNHKDGIAYWRFVEATNRKLLSKERNVQRH